MDELSWEAYLALKKIDAAAYQQGAPVQYALFEQQFLQMHPESFTAHKLFLLNYIRRAYPLLAQHKQSK